MVASSDPCSRCGRPTFGTSEDRGRYACPECSSVEIVRLDTRNVLYRLCARSRFEYSSQNLLGACAGMWTALWRRIELDLFDEPGLRLLRWSKATGRNLEHRNKASDGATRRRIPRLQPSLALKAMPPEPGRPQEAGRALRSGPA